MRPFLLLVCLSFSLALTAQTKQKAEAAFVAELNDIIRHSTQQHWAFEGEKMTVDTAYAISKAGILSVTISYRKEDGAVTITRTEAPVNKIRRVAYDLYLILEFDGKEVSTYTANNGSTVLRATEKTDYFHIGAPLPEDMSRQARLQKLLDEVQKYYRK
ncbi:hypothetical protein [Ferruginibacter sp. HRS2-29]|uniref:hypothetical protein n=1 Tax=Ferruginibacter sp. HRS2-29 TaxID=2487334 RepID=UPI0020CD3C00|nr:hypothetical protein [Ferruginibacter sp. HRS2-29]MCP9752333.1 hypothetical protein [Ferruginibacter sp. HRS2-29]